MRPAQLSSIDLNLLTLADALLETRSVTATAKIVHLSQPAVSRALARLRDQLGDPLLVRERRSMVLTPFAKQLRPRLRSALLQLERTLAQEEHFDARTARGTLTIATADYAAIAFMPGALRRLGAEAPQIELVVVPYVEPFEPFLESGECDLVIGPRPSDKGWILSEPSFASDWCCVARAGHPWLQEPSLDRFCAAGHILVSPMGQGGGHVDAVMHAHGRARRIAARVPEFAGALALAAQTDLLLTVPERLAWAALRITPLGRAPVPLPMPSSEVFMSWHSARSDEPRLIWSRRIVTEVVGDDADPASS